MIAITGNQIRAARVLAGINQRALAKAAGKPVQTISRMEGSGAKRIVSRNGTIADVLAAPGSYAVMMQQRGVALVQEMKTPAEAAATAGISG
jgi:transcriptional regulator with XRE-family HTH domain